MGEPKPKTTIPMYTLILWLLLAIGAIAAESPDFEDHPLVFEVIDVDLWDQSTPTPPTTVEVSITPEGFLAETRIYMEVPSNFIEENAEGVMDFELPHGSVMTGLKLGISEMMVDGMGVEERLAERAYETEVGRRVDPALLSHRGDSRYRLQIYPIPPESSRKVEISWIQPLREREELLIYDFPLMTTESIDIQALEVRLPTETSILFENLPGELHETASVGVREYHLPAGRYLIDTDLKLSIKEDAILGTRWSSKWGETSYSSIRFPESTEFDTRVERISLLWDASLSRSFADHRKEVEFVRDCLHAMETELVQLFLIKNGIVEYGSFSDTDGWDELTDVLDTLIYDGYSDASLVNEFLAMRGQIPSIFVTDNLEYSWTSLDKKPAALVIVSNDKYRNWYNAMHQLRALARGMVWYLDDAVNDVGVRRISQFLNRKGEEPLDSLIEFDNLGELRGIHWKEESADGGTKRFELIPDYPRYIEGLRIANESYPRPWFIREIDEQDGIWNVVSPFTSLLVLEDPYQYFRWGIAPPQEVPWDRGLYEKMVVDQKEWDLKSHQSSVRQFASVLDDINDWLESDFTEAGDPGRYGSFLSEVIDATTLPDKYWAVTPWEGGGCFPAGTLV